MATKQKPQSTDLAPTNLLAGLPAEFLASMTEDAGKGVSRDPTDQLVPLIYILQAQSPQVNKRNPDYLEGAEAGSIWLRNASRPIAASDTGILFQPCHFSKDWVEWVPRDSGGGFVARHDMLPTDAQALVDPKQPAKVRYVRPNGNEVIETRYHIGLVYLSPNEAIPYVIPMTSSGHTVSRQWMFMMNSKQLPGGKIAPSWANLYRLKTKERSNAAGTWFTWDVADAGLVPDMETYLRGKALNTSFISGEKTVEAPEATFTDAPASDGAM